MTTTDTAIDELRRDLKQRHLTALWELEAEIMGLAPSPRTQAWLWEWSELYDVAQRAGALVPVERGGDRRAIALSNPGQHGMPYATSTLWAAVQWLNGHEVAPAHRHTSQAVRIIIDGAGSYSTVEGDKVFIERGDLVLTPPWLWHDHGSESSERRTVRS
jgi:gentisate 1,2-dioxygenase